VVFAAEMRREAVQTANIAGQIKEGLAEDRFFPFFQPQVEMPGGQLCGFEALVRWRRADGTVVPASAFLDVANETGLIGLIDRHMMSASLDLLSELPSSGSHRHCVSLNFSSVQLRNPAIVEQLLDETMARGLKADQVNLEILESTLLDDCSDTVASNIRSLAEAGFRIELDDFGTGHTALASLRRFPVHRIKIDRSLIRDIDTEAASRAITEGIFTLCRKLGIEAIAEGVETAAELETLRGLGLRKLQGDHFAHPMPKETLLAWLGGHDRALSAG
jgi:EAL domain-containing protein (putative c-di-GMP-specific phosphodiesterase class I)